MRNAQAVQPPQHRLGQQRARRIGIDHHQRHIRRLQRGEAIGGKAGAAGHVDQREVIAQIVEMHQIEFGRAAPRARFRAGIADAGARLDAALPGYRAAGIEQRFGEAGLARAGRPDQRDRTGCLIAGFATLGIDAAH